MNFNYLILRMDHTHLQTYSLLTYTRLVRLKMCPLLYHDNAQRSALYKGEQCSVQPLGLKCVVLVCWFPSTAGA